MKTKEKTLDCVALQHEGGQRVQAMTEGMSAEQYNAFWQKELEKFPPQPDPSSSPKGKSPVAKLPPLPEKKKRFDCVEMTHKGK
jgi:hypothetical protein